MIDSATLRQLLTDIDGSRAVIDMDMGGLDPGVGKVLPLPLDHAQLLDMVTLLLGPYRAEIEFAQIIMDQQARYSDLSMKYNQLAADKSYVDNQLRRLRQTKLVVPP